MKREPVARKGTFGRNAFPCRRWLLVLALAGLCAMAAAAEDAVTVAQGLVPAGTRLGYCATRFGPQGEELDPKPTALLADLDGDGKDELVMGYIEEVESYSRKMAQAKVAVYRGQPQGGWKRIWNTEEGWGKDFCLFAADTWVQAGFVAPENLVPAFAVVDLPQGAGRAIVAVRGPEATEGWSIHVWRLREGKIETLHRGSSATLAYAAWDGPDGLYVLTAVRFSGRIIHIPSLHVWGGGSFREQRLPAALYTALSKYYTGFAERASPDPAPFLTRQAAICTARAGDLASAIQQYQASLKTIEQVLNQIEDEAAQGDVDKQGLKSNLLSEAAETTRYLGRAYVATGNLENGLKWLKQAGLYRNRWLTWRPGMLRSLPGGPIIQPESLAYYYLGQFYQESDATNQALAAYNMAVQLDPKNTDARQAADGLRASQS
jgi:hypothetical protein